MTVGVAKLRLLPRTGGVRVIENMGSHLSLPFIQATTVTHYNLLTCIQYQATPTNKQERSINSKLQNLFHILNYEKVCSKIASVCIATFCTRCLTRRNWVILLLVLMTFTMLQCLLLNKSKQKTEQSKAVCFIRVYFMIYIIR